jgi:hypothetical protein
MRAKTRARKTNKDSWYWIRWAIYMLSIIFIFGFISSVIIGLDDKVDNSVPNDVNKANDKLSEDFLPGNPCRLHFKPVCEMYPYVRYWNQMFTSKDCYESPLSTRSLPITQQKYLIFEPDRGGWNNIRMSAEVAIVFAHATGRTLVLPPKEKWYLLDKNSRAKMKSTSKTLHDNHGRFDKFFNFSKVSETMRVITMETFLTDIAQRKLLHKQPPKAKLNTLLHPDGTSKGVRIGWLWKYMEESCYVREWEPGRFFIGLNLIEPSSNNSSIYSSDCDNKFRPFSTVKSSRFIEMQATQKRTMIPYDKKLHNEIAIFFPGDYRRQYRMLTHFYTYLYFDQERREHFYKRFVRDRLHYVDEIFCAAGRVVRSIHDDAAKILNVSHYTSEDRVTRGGNTSFGPTYFAYHIRRGDFQYKDTRVSSYAILQATKHLLDKYSERTKLLYIATDEKDKTFFKPFHDHFDVRFLDDYIEKAQLKHTDKNLIGMIEQVIAANAHTFIGTFKSTFTGYIMRMRGYYRDGRYDRSYYTTKQHTTHLQRQRPLIGPFWAREFETAHRQIDDDFVVAHQRQLR